MEILPLGPGFAAELRGITLSDVTVDDAAYAAVRAAFEEHSVLVFRGQDVTDEGQLAFSRRFGTPEITKVGSASAGTYFAVLTTIGEDGKVVPADHRLALRNRANQLWHTDSSFKRVPALTSVTKPVGIRVAAVACGRARSTWTSGSVSTGEVSARAGTGSAAVSRASSKDAITASRAPQSNGPASRR